MIKNKAPEALKLRADLIREVENGRKIKIDRSGAFGGIFEGL